MKNIKYFIITYFVFINSVSYSQWYSLSTPISNYHYSCYFINAHTGWVSGDGMKLLHTTDGGLNWQTLNPPNPNDRSESMFFVNSNTGFIGSYYGRIYKTTDGGFSWTFTQVSMYTEQRVLGLYFLNEQTGWAVGQMGIFRKTVNGGASWVYAPGSFPNELLTSVYFMNELTGWVLGRSTTSITKTTNGGSTWVQTSFPLDSYYYRFYGISFIDELTGWAYGSGGLVAKTINAGYSWEVIDIQPTNSTTFYLYTDGHFINSNIGYLSGIGSTPGPTPNQYALLRKTIDGGFNWAFINICCASAYEDMHFVDDNTGYIVGSNKILKTTNGGLVNIVNISETTPQEFILEQNYPNPFNPSTTVKFSLPGSTNISLKVFDINGREIAILINNEFYSSGKYSVTFNAENLSSGIYFYKLISDEKSDVKSMIYLK